MFQRLHWPCSYEDEQLCLMKGKSSSDCQNYIHLLYMLDTSSSLLLVCGTNCYSPLCRHYHLMPDGQHQVTKQFSGRGYAPFQPGHSSTSLYTGGSLYSATTADFSQTDSLVIKNMIRTEQFDYKHLNGQNFRRTFF